MPFSVHIHPKTKVNTSWPQSFWTVFHHMDEKCTFVHVSENIYTCCSRWFYYFIHPIYIREGWLNNRNTSLYNAIHFSSTKTTSSKMIIQLNQHHFKRVSIKTEHYKLNEVGFSAVLLYQTTLVLSMCT